MRVHILAKELSVPSKTIVEKCRAEGIDSVKNHMSTLSAGLHATIREWFSEGSHDVALETSKRVDLESVRIKPRRKRAGTAATASLEPTADAVAGTATAELGEEINTEVPETAPTETVMVSEAAVEDVGTAAAADTLVGPAETTPTEEAPREVEAQRAVAEVQPADSETPDTAAGAAAAAEAPPAEAPIQQPVPEPPPPTPIVPAGPQHVPAPAKLQGPRVVRYEPIEYGARPPTRPLAGRTGSQAADGRPPTTSAPAPSQDKGKVPEKDVRRRGRINPRRAASRLNEAGERMSEWRNRDLAERKERLAGATGRRIVRRRTAQAAPSRGQLVSPGPTTEATVNEPVRLKEFCSATGLNFLQLFKIIQSEYGLVPNINMTLPPEVAELLALHFGIELTVVPARTKLDDLREAFANRSREHEQPRPPVVTMLGHVDHGKTSLLDAIRKAHVVATEDGGITQHIGSYHVQSAHGPVTFLDTPGHAAFTAMRARGAQITDVVVLVIAADDGVMPQTVEAINHAKAAQVPIVVALNKIDLGDQNKLKIYGQLAERGLTPSGEWGGDVDVIPTSATTKAGIDDLVEHLADLTSVLELKADPTLPAQGVVIEAETKPGVGPVIRVLIQCGTLHVGDFVVCGSAACKVRALVNDRGERVDSAGPSMPIEVWGADGVPSAGDPLHQVDSLQYAKEVAGETRQARVDSARQQTRRATSLQEMLQRRVSEDIPELNIIIRADVDGSAAALTHALSKVPSDEVKLAIRHAGVGAVNDSDVLLASTCDGIVVAFRVEASVGAKRLADVHHVDIRSYRVIYDVCDDIKKALEGLLAPAESIETRATAEVREMFHLGKKIGMIAGSHVTNGLLERNHLAKVIRDSVVVREGAKIASLRRFKDDAKEVRAGLECGIRLEGFDDVHVGDIIETYEIIKTARTL